MVGWTFSFSIVCKRDVNISHDLLSSSSRTKVPDLPRSTSRIIPWIIISLKLTLDGATFFKPRGFNVCLHINALIGLHTNCQFITRAFFSKQRTWIWCWQFLNWIRISAFLSFSAASSTRPLEYEWYILPTSYFLERHGRDWECVIGKFCISFYWFDSIYCFLLLYWACSLIDVMSIPTIIIAAVTNTGFSLL